MIDAAQHMRLAYRIASRLRSRWEGLMPREDAEGWAMLGLVKAANRYDPARGLAFSTYAGYRIAGEIRDAIRREAGGRYALPLDTPLGVRTIADTLAVSDDPLSDAEAALDGAVSAWARWAATLRPAPVLPRVRRPAVRRDRRRQREQMLTDVLQVHGWRREAVG